MADGTVRKLAGVIPISKIRLHDFLMVELKNLRVLPGTFSRVIIGSDILPLDNSNPLLREVGIQRDGQRQICKVEVGPVRTGLELALPLFFAPKSPNTSGGGLQENANAASDFPKGGM